MQGVKLMQKVAVIPILNLNSNYIILCLILGGKRSSVRDPVRLP